ncbi:PepSY domain-containing protein [Nocardioides humilatus]|uniref:PepSY domain-containing protein n=1 Tax=Nocardioides humilatus TaxID=2607660 RepID=A0A5B1LDL4_9ACTN|nr:PepSY domain-containing protein [Nocardioides humilatus]KAA1417829.1 PepSY domain-containing protein [Nocardioides humilatus]
MNLRSLNKKTKIGVAAGAAVLLAGGIAGTAFAGGGDDDETDRPIPAADLEQASDAALAETGGGTVTETEVNDEESKYEVEVTMDDGTQIDVQLDENFNVVGTKSEGPGHDDD